MTGTIKTVITDKLFGFIKTPGSPDIFFHQRDLVGIDWDASLAEMAVEFDVRETDKGLRASSVRKAF